MRIRVIVIAIHEDGTHVCEMVDPHPGKTVTFGRGEAAVLVEWIQGRGEALEISDEVAKREGLIP